MLQIEKTSSLKKYALRFRCVLSLRAMDRSV